MANVKTQIIKVAPRDTGFSTDDALGLVRKAEPKAKRGKKKPPSMDDGPIDGGEQAPSHSLSIDDRQFGRYVILPPVDFAALALLPQQSSILMQCIQAMVTNIDGYGWDLEYIGPPAPVAEPPEIPKPEPVAPAPMPPPAPNAPVVGDPKDPSQQAAFARHNRAVAGHQEQLQAHGAQAAQAAADQKNKANQDAYDRAVADRAEKLRPPATGPESDEAVAEAQRIRTFFACCNPRESFDKLRAKLRSDIETLGNGYLELIPNLQGEIVGLEHLPGQTVRMTPLDRTPIPVDVTMIGDEGALVERKVWMRFRRFVQVQDARRVYFREAGDPRSISSLDGQELGVPADAATTEATAPSKGPKVSGTTVAKFDELIPAPPIPGLDGGRGARDRAQDDPATEVLHFGCIYNPASPYYLPRFFGNLPSIRGSRYAELTWLAFYRRHAIPALVVAVSGGALNAESYRRIKEFFQEEQSDSDGGQRALIIEAVTANAPIEAQRANVVIDVKPIQGDRAAETAAAAYDEENRSKVMGSFRLPPIFMGHTKDHNYACYSADTEVLTAQGWQRHDQWAPGTPVACVDPVTGEMTFQVPAELCVYPFQGDLFAIRSGVTDLLVTPGHRMYYAPPSGRWRVEPIEAMLAHPRVVVRAVPGSWSGTPVAPVAVPWRPIRTGPYAATDQPLAPLPADLALETLGLYVSEGGTCDAWTTQWSVGQGVAHLAAVECILARLEAHGVRIAWHASEVNGAIYSNVCNKSLRDWLVSACGQRSHEKHLPAWALDAPLDQLRVLFEALMLGDGTSDSRPGRTARAYYTTSEVLAGQVQSLAMRLGYRAHVRAAARGPFGVRDCYRVLLSEHACSTVYAEDVTREAYDGLVYCFRVPTGVYVTRRNGTVAIQGNTAQASRTTAEEQVFQPERNAFDEVINLRVLRPLGMRYWRFFSKAPEIADVATYTAAMQAFSAVGAMTPNQAIELQNELLGTTLDPIKEEWGDYPFPIVLGLLQQQRLKGLDEITDKAAAGAGANPLANVMGLLGGAPGGKPGGMPGAKPAFGAPPGGTVGVPDQGATAKPVGPAALSVPKSDDDAAADAALGVTIARKIAHEGDAFTAAALTEVLKTQVLLYDQMRQLQFRLSTKVDLAGGDLAAGGALNAAQGRDMLKTRQSSMTKRRGRVVYKPRR